MEKKTIELFRELTEMSGAPGHEKQVREFMKAKMEGLCDEIIMDRLGSVFAVKRSKKENAPKLMYAGHMDEVGFIINDILPNGMIKFLPLGGWYSQQLLTQRVKIQGSKGEVIGVISSVSPHLLSDADKKQPAKIENMMIDLGCSSKSEVLDLGIKPGDPITPAADFVELAGGNRLLAKAFDNRYGCVLALDLLEALKDIDLDCDLYIGATVQEEIGTRGAITSANMINPDIFIGADCSPARDESGSKNVIGSLGEGCLLRVHDRSMVTLPGMKNYFLECANKLGVKYQYYTSPGGTDAGAIHMSNIGVPSIIVGIPSRYIHSHSSIIDKSDYDEAFKLVFDMIKNFDTIRLEEIINS